MVTKPTSHQLNGNTQTTAYNWNSKSTKSNNLLTSPGRTTAKMSNTTPSSNSKTSISAVSGGHISLSSGYSTQTTGTVSATGKPPGSASTMTSSSGKLISGSASTMSAATMSGPPRSDSNSASSRPVAVSTWHVSRISKYPGSKSTSMKMNISKTSLRMALSTATTHDHSTGSPLGTSASTLLFSSILTQAKQTTTNIKDKQTTIGATMSTNTPVGGIPNSKITSNSPTYLNASKAQLATSNSQTKSGVTKTMPVYGSTRIATNTSSMPGRTGMILTSRSTPMNQQTSASIQTFTTPIPIQPISCMLCSGPSFICENRFHSEVCPDPSHQYCINDMTNNRDGTRTVEKRCATKLDCERDWWRDTSDRQECTTYNPQIAYAYVFKCSFCCKGENCNLNLIPGNLYQGTSHH